MDTIFMNFGNSKTSDPYRLLINLSDKTKPKRTHKYVALSNLSFYYTWKNILKNHTKMKSLNCLIGHILYQIFILRK